MLCRGSCHQRRHFYPRSPCGERPYGALKHMHEEEISIHALLAESDGTPLQQYPQPGCYFYPRSPCGERHIVVESVRYDYEFLSTLSLRRATWPPVRDIIQWEDFYPRSPCGERPIPYFRGYIRSNISIHALLAESDPSTTRRLTNLMISIHALLAESDLGNSGTQADPAKYFYPRSPCGERLFSLFGVFLVCIFLSTLSLRRATPQGCFVLS